MANIAQLINNIRNAVYGKDVRESIAGAIEQTYEDASEQGNANMEVVDARNGFNTLKHVINKKMYYFNNVAEMKACTQLKIGDFVQTLGYYEKNDGGSGKYVITNNSLSDDGGSVHELENELRAELIVENGILNILQFGAKNDNSKDTTEIFNKMIATNYNKIYIPQGQYKINDIVNLKSNMNIKGVFNGSNLNITSSGQLQIGTNSESFTNVILQDLTIRCNGTRSSYAIHFENANLCKILNCLIRSDDGTSKYNGVAFELTNNLLHCYDNKIINNQFQRTHLRLKNSTDNFISDNMIWGNDLLNTGALQLEGACHNNSIINNHFAVSEGGALRIQDTCNQLRITNNYFDKMGIGINGNGLVEAIIDNNIFFKPQQSIVITSLYMSTLSNNTFKDSDVENEGYPDVKLTNQGGNTISGNKHYRTDDVTHTNKAVAYDIPESNLNYPHTVINMATVWFTNYYDAQDTTQNRNHFINCYPNSLF